MKERIDRHKDGSIKARGNTIDGELTGYWEWFRKDGTKMRSGYFDNGKQVGEWTTYDASGKPFKVTKMKVQQGSEPVSAGAARGNRERFSLSKNRVRQKPRRVAGDRVRILADRQAARRA